MRPILKSNTSFSDVGYGVITPRITNADFINLNQLADLFNGVLPTSDKILTDLSNDPRLLDPVTAQRVAGQIRDAISNFELPYTERTGASKYRFIAIRLLTNSYGRLLPPIGSGGNKRCSILFSLVFFNYVCAYNLSAKRRLNDIADQGISINSSTLVSIHCYRNHYTSGMSLTLKAIDELFLHPNWADEKFLPEFAGTMLFKDVFFSEGNVQEFLQLHSSVRIQTAEAIEWNDTPWASPISTDGGNFITCGSVNVFQTFVGQKANSVERLVQILPSVSIQKFSDAQSGFVIVNSPYLIDSQTNHQVPESDTHETFMFAIPKIGVAEVALKMCMKGNGTSEPRDPKPTNNKGPRRGPKNRRNNGRNQDSTDTSREGTEDPTDIPLDPLRNAAVIGSEIGKGPHNSRTARENRDK
jgi:hypothetical protein